MSGYRTTEAGLKWVDTSDPPFGIGPDVPARCSCGGKGKLVGTVDGKPACGKCMRHALRVGKSGRKNVRRHKYNVASAPERTVDGIIFDSVAEARRYCELKLLQQVGQIRNLERQVPYSIDINGVHVCTWFADFVYFDEARRIVEDVKGYKTKEYILKRKLVAAVYGITIKEVKMR